jgi:hypothetical protein
VTSNIRPVADAVAIRNSWNFTDTAIGENEKIVFANGYLPAFCFPDLRSSYAILLALRDAGLNVSKRNPAMAR